MARFEMAGAIANILDLHALKLALSLQHVQLLFLNHLSDRHFNTDTIDVICRCYNTFVLVCTVSILPL